MARILFVLPRFSRRPIGGYKIVYEHANRLADRGHRVFITQEIGTSAPSTMWERGHKLAERAALRLYPKDERLPWFDLHPQVTLELVGKLSPRRMPETDFAVATAWQTADVVRRLPLNPSRKFYFVQDYEVYRLADDVEQAKIRVTYDYGLRAMASSPAVMCVLSECGINDAAFVPCAIDLDVYRMRVDIESPDRSWIGFPVRNEPHKRTQDAIEAIQIARAALGEDLKVWAFGTSRSSDLPAWVEFQARPSDSELAEWHNRSAIFLLPSAEEGWGLPGSEAQACGAALVAAASGGVQGYARHDVTAMLAPPMSSQLLAEHIVTLWRDAPRRHNIARAGYQKAQELHWNTASGAMLRALGLSENIEIAGATHSR